MEGTYDTMKNYLKMIIASVCLAMLLICIGSGFTNGVDEGIYQFLKSNITSDWTIQYFTFISIVLSPINCLIYVIILLIVLYIRNRVKCWWYGFWCFSVFGIGTIFKYVIQRPRPNVMIDGFSFPSMHVLSVCVFVSLILLIKNHKVLQCIAIFLVISIMISRIYLQAHYFTDTIGSLIVLYIMLQALHIGKLNDKDYKI